MRIRRRGCYRATELDDVADESAGCVVRADRNARQRRSQPCRCIRVTARRRSCFRLRDLGREPLLKEPGPVWVIQIKGDVPQRSAIWTNPICFVTNSDTGYMGTGPITNPATGKTTQPEAPAVAPDRKLPSLAP